MNEKSGKAEGIWMILAADIGGTKVVLALFENSKDRKKIREKKFVSKEHASFEEIVTSFVSKDEKIKAACLGIAGPVLDNKCHATNLPWVVDGRKIEHVLQMKEGSVFLINDLEANAWGTFVLRKDELYTLHQGEERKANCALISAGTGLGEAGFYFNGKTLSPFSTEGGHAGFSPTNEEELDIWRYFFQKYGHVSFERILSGKGIEGLYRFFVEVKGMSELAEAKALMQKEDPAKVISDFALEGKCAVCKKTLDTFVSIYGAEAGNLALKFLALGGVFIGGGIAPKILEILKSGIFMESFVNKGRFKALLSKITVQVILNPETALLGAAKYAEDKIS